ncbi:30S ribosomal protein S14 [Nitriliruptoraceae bacterium ZYF776]|nr:30S ribosomal protein S14 [Profundirhabdus halotolerans]
MAKTSKIVKDAKRREIVARYAERRAAAKAVLADPKASADAKSDARRALDKMPRDASPTRLRNRGGTTGRPRGVLTRFQLDRIAFREKALNGELPGIRKASW